MKWACMELAASFCSRPLGGGGGGGGTDTTVIRLL